MIMSQKKVDRYKEEKANRKKIMKREKMKRTALTISSTVVGVAIVGWLGYSAFGYFHKEDEKTPTQTEVDLSALNDYISGLYAEEEAAE